MPKTQQVMLCISSEFGIQLGDHLNSIAGKVRWFTEATASLDHPFRAAQRLPTQIRG